MPEHKLTMFEPYFLAWDSVMHYPNPSAGPGEREMIYGYSGNEAMIPCHQHKTCKALVAAKGAAPPKVCPHCGVLTTLEVAHDATPPELDPETGLNKPHDFYKPAFTTFGG